MDRAAVDLVHEPWTYSMPFPLEKQFLIPKIYWAPVFCRKVHIVYFIYVIVPTILQKQA
jgi:hypothetical protein